MLTERWAAMGGDTELLLVDAPADAVALVTSIFARYEAALSRFIDDSELCALNAAAGRAFEASPLLFGAVSAAVGWARRTGGTFDPTMLDALEHAGYTASFASMHTAARDPSLSTNMERGQPEGSTWSAGQAWRDIALDEARRRITLPARVRLDLGGIGKGYTVDRAAAALGRGANAMINASGDLFAAGAGSDGGGWLVGVEDPFSPAHDLAVLRVRDRGVATSGTSRKQWTRLGGRYHHLIDPREGACSRSDALSVTVVAACATAADVLAKTAFLRGAKGGLTMIEARPGAECLIVSTGRGVTMSSGMAEYLA